MYLRDVVPQYTEYEGTTKTSFFEMSLNYQEAETAIVLAHGTSVPVGATVQERRTAWQRVLDKHPLLFWIGSTGVRRKPRALWEKYSKLRILDRQHGRAAQSEGAEGKVPHADKDRKA